MSGNNVAAPVENRLDLRLRECREAGRTALIVYVTAGYPDLDTTRRVIPELFEAGADVVEIGVPFSDPLADGPTIQRAVQHALRLGVTPPDVLEVARDTRASGVADPLVCLSYINPVLQAGWLDDPAVLAEAGFDGLIVPDLPSLENEPARRACSEHGVHLIPFLTPTSPPEAFARVAAEPGGFVYCVSVTGVTGSREELPTSTGELLRAARASCRRPVAVGFGISGAEAARRLANEADGIIVGSALVARMSGEGSDPVAAASELVLELRQALDAARRPEKRVD